MHISRPHAELVTDIADRVFNQSRLSGARKPATIAVAVEAFGNILLAEEADGQDYVDFCNRIAARRPQASFIALIDARITQSALTGVTATIFEDELGTNVGVAHSLLGLACARCYFDRYMGYTAEGCAWSIEIGRAGRPEGARWPASRVELLLGHHP